MPSNNLGPQSPAPRRRWRKRYIFLAVCGVLFFSVLGVLGYYYTKFSRMIDDRLMAERKASHG